MEKKYKVLGIGLGYLSFLVVYVLIFSMFFPIINYIVIGSVTAVSAGTLYHVVQQPVMSAEIRLKKKRPPTSSPIIQRTEQAIPTESEEQNDLLEEYLEVLPYVQEYVESEELHEEFPLMTDVIFSTLNQGDLAKIDQLNLSHMEKLEFIREILYFNAEERNTLIDNMIQSQDLNDKVLKYVPPSSIVQLGDKFRIHVISLIDPGEMKKIVIIDSIDAIEKIKEDIGVLFDYNLDEFLLSSGGIILQEDLAISDYPLEDDDEIVLIPPRIPQEKSQ